MTNSELLLSKLALLGQSANTIELVDYNVFGQLVNAVDALVDKLDNVQETVDTNVQQLNNEVANADIQQPNIEEVTNEEQETEVINND